MSGGVVRDGGADRMVRGLTDMPDEQVAILIAIESLGERTNYLEWVLDTTVVCPSKHAGRQTTGRSGRIDTASR